MKKKKLITRLLAIKSDQCNGEFHTDYKRQKRNSPLIKSHNELPKIKHTLNKNIPINFHTSLNLFKSSRNNNNLQILQNNSPCLETERICYPKIFQNNFYIKDNNSSSRAKIQKKENKALSMKYLDLFQEPKEYDYIFYNKIIQEEDNFFKNEILENITDKNIKQEFLNKIKVYKDNYDNTMENFIIKTLYKYGNEPPLLIEKIPDEIINNYAESIYKEILNIKDNKNMIKVEINNEDEKNSNIPKKNNELIIHNVFLEFALKNTRKKLELINQYNKQLSISYISKLINNEIKKLKLAIVKLKRLSKKKFSTIETNQNNNQGLLDINKLNNNINSFSPLTDRYSYDKEIIKNKINHRSLNINRPLNIRYQYNNNDFIKINSNNINHNDTDDMYITEVNKEYPFLIKKNIDKIKVINSLNNPYNVIDTHNGQNKNYFNNIKTMRNKVIESYSGKESKPNGMNNYNNKNYYKNILTFPRISKENNEDTHYNNTLMDKSSYIDELISSKNYKDNNHNLNQKAQTDNHVIVEKPDNKTLRQLNKNDNNNNIKNEKLKINNNSNSESKLDSENMKENYNSKHTSENIMENNDLKNDFENKKENQIINNKIDTNNHNNKNGEHEVIENREMPKKDIINKDLNNNQNVNDNNNKNINENKIINKNINENTNQNINKTNDIDINENNKEENENNKKTNENDNKNINNNNNNIEEKGNNDKKEKKEDKKNTTTKTNINDTKNIKDKDSKESTDKNKNIDINKKDITNKDTKDKKDMIVNVNTKRKDRTIYKDDKNKDISHLTIKNNESKKESENNDETINHINFNKTKNNSNNNSNNISNSYINKEEPNNKIEKIDINKKDKIDKRINNGQNKEEIAKTDEIEEKISTLNKRHNRTKTINNPIVKKIKNNINNINDKKSKFSESKEKEDQTQSNNNNDNEQIFIDEKSDKKNDVEHLSFNKKKHHTNIMKPHKFISPKKDKHNSHKKNSSLSKHSKRNSYSINSIKDSNNNLSNNSKIKDKVIRQLSIRSKNKKKSNIRYNNITDNEYEESEEINDNTTSILNNTQKLNMSENTASASELTLKDDDIDKLLKFINKEKQSKFKTIPEEENETVNDNKKTHNIFHNNKKNNFKGLKGVIHDKDKDKDDEILTKSDLLEKLKRNDQDIKIYLQNLIYSKLLNEKESSKRKKRLKLVYKGENNEIFKLAGNFNFVQNFYKHYNNESEDEELLEEENESKTSEKSEDLKDDDMSQTQDDISSEKMKKNLNLIYDNSYLFKKDDKKFKIRKEVEDILNGIYNKNKENEKKEDVIIDNEFLKRKYEQKFLESYFLRQKFKKRRKKGKKISKNKKETKGIFLDESFDQQMFNRNQEIYEKEEFDAINKEKKEKSLEWRINYFFNKIKKMKLMDKEDDFIKRIDKYAEFDMKDFKIKRDREVRMRDFILGLNDYRVTRKVQRKLFDTYIYKEPILIENFSPDRINYSVEENSDIEIKKNINCPSTNRSQDKSV